MKIAIVMTVFNRLEKTRKCIEDLEVALRNVEHTYYITDDGSTDDTRKFLEEQGKNVNIKIYEGDGSLYWNRGMYYSYERALKKQYDFYLWVNNDTEFYMNFWNTLMSDFLDASKENDFCAICGSVQSKVNMKATYGGTNNNGLISPTGNIEKCTHINGNCLLIPYGVANKIGNLDYAYEHGLGDFDYGQRILAEGGQLYASSSFVGTCEKNDVQGTWKDVSLPIRDRIRLMKAKTGQPRASYKHYLKKWNKKDWVLYYYKPYFDIVKGRITYILLRRGMK